MDAQLKLVRAEGELKRKEAQLTQMSTAGAKPNVVCCLPTQFLLAELVPSFA